MSLQEVIIEGTLEPDGTLRLDEKPNLPAGRVQVTVQALPVLPEGDPFWDTLKAIWADQKKRGHVPRTVEEVEAERRQFRDDWEERMQRLERIRAEGQALRKAQENGS